MTWAQILAARGSLGREKWPEQHARAVGMQDELAALDGGGLHGRERITKRAG